MTHLSVFVVGYGFFLVEQSGLQSGYYLVCTDQQAKVLHIQKKCKQYITMFHPLTAAALNFF